MEGCCKRGVISTQRSWYLVWCWLWWRSSLSQGKHRDLSSTTQGVKEAGTQHSTYLGMTGLQWRKSATQFRGMPAHDSQPILLGWNFWETSNHHSSRFHTICSIDSEMYIWSDMRWGLTVSEAPPLFVLGQWMEGSELEALVAPEEALISGRQVDDLSLRSWKFIFIWVSVLTIDCWIVID